MKDRKKRAALVLLLSAALLTGCTAAPGNSAGTDRKGETVIELSDQGGPGEWCHGPGEARRRLYLS